nr:hypothetical protein CFP56_35095 [Quercus suber]
MWQILLKRWCFGTMRKTGVVSLSMLESWTGPKFEAINSETRKFTYGIKNPYAGRLIYGCYLSQQVLVGSCGQSS